MNKASMTWKKLTAEKKVSALVKKFEVSHGGERAFLRYLWERDNTTIRDETPVLSKPEEYDKWKKISRLSADLDEEFKRLDIDALPFTQRCLAVVTVGGWEQNRLAMLAAQAKQIETALATMVPGSKSKGERGRPLTLERREYWCAALVPYFEFKRKRGGRWKWIADWLKEIGVRSNTTAVSMSDWWAGSMVASTNRRFVDDRGRRKRDPIRGLERGITGRHLHMLVGAMSYPVWKKWRPVPEVKRYISIARRRIPFLKFVLAEDFFSKPSLGATSSRKKHNGWHSLDADDAEK